MLRKITVIMTAAAMTIGLAACGSKDSAKDEKESTMTEQSGESETMAETPTEIPTEIPMEIPTETPTETPEDSTAEEKKDEILLPKGADSLYELYSVVTDYLNNGFNDDELAAVSDCALLMAFNDKMEEDEEDILTYGLDAKESYALFRSLVNNAEALGLPLDEEGEFEDDLIDLEALRKGLPDDMQKQLDKYPDAYEDQAERIYEYLYDITKDNGKNPFGTKQVSWDKAGENGIPTEEYDGYDDWNEDMLEAFPRVTEVSLGKFEEGNLVYDMSFYCIELDDKFYFLGFSTVVGSTGG